MTTPGRGTNCGTRSQTNVGMINSQSLLKDVAKWDEPPTQLVTEEECRDFIAPPRRRRGRAKTAPATTLSVIKPRSIVSNPPQPVILATKKRTGGKDRKKPLLDVRNHLFVGALPHHLTQIEIKTLFQRYGKIKEVILFGAPRTAKLNFGFVVFDRQEDLRRALSGPPMCVVDGKGHRYELNVEKRRDARLAQVKKWDSSETDLECAKSSHGSTVSSEVNVWDRGRLKAYETPREVWQDLLKRFNWQHAAAKYLFRTMTMEDYLAAYCHALCSYWEANEISLSLFISRLVELAETCPARDLNEIMPPSISGLVYNQAGGPKGGTSQGQTFDLASILLRSPELFEIKEGQILVKGVTSKDTALKSLQTLLLEGLFVYFFAKFCHGPVFAIKISYYERSEPIHSVLKIITGYTTMALALETFFQTYSELFHYQPEVGELTLNVDYFSKSYKEDMRTYLENNRLFHPSLPSVTQLIASSEADSTESETDDFRSVSSDPEIPTDILGLVDINDLLAPVEAVQRKTLAEIQDLPYSVRSVIQPCLLDIEDHAPEVGLISNPLGVDSIIHKCEAALELKIDVDIPKFKEEFEIESRKLMQQMLGKYNLKLTRPQNFDLSAKIRLLSYSSD